MYKVKRDRLTLTTTKITDLIIAKFRLSARGPHCCEAMHRVHSTPIFSALSEMSRFRNRLKQLACSPEELAVDETADTSEAAQKAGTEEYFVQTGCGLGEWVAVGGEASAQPTSDYTLIDDTESVHHVESIPADEEPEVKIVGESCEPTPIICLDSDAEERKEEETQVGTEEKDEEKKAEPIAEPLIDLDAGETAEEASKPPAEEKPEPRYPYPKGDYRQVAMQQQQQQWVYQQPPQYTPGMYPYPVATSVQGQPQPGVPGPISTSAPSGPAPTTAATSEAAPVSEGAPASAPPSSATDPAPVYPYPNYPPPLNGPMHAGLWNATVNAATGIMQALHGGWASSAAAAGPTNTTATATSGDNYSYPSEHEMQQLLEMGFCNREQNKALLQKHNNNVQAVVAELIGQTNDGWYASRH